MKSSHRFARVLPLRRDFFSEEQGHLEEEEEEAEEAEEGLDNRKKSTLLFKDEQTLQDDLIVSAALCMLCSLYYLHSASSLENTRWTFKDVKVFAFFQSKGWAEVA